MRVSRIRFDGIGPFDNATFEIPPPPEGQTGELVLFEGPNGSGKSTIMEAIATAAAAAPQNHVAGILGGITENESWDWHPPVWLGRFRQVLAGGAEVEFEQAGERAS